MPFQKRITFDNTTDLFRGTPIAQHTPEHVVQSGLGGVMEVVGLIDHKTNTDLGGTIDKAVMESLSCFRAMVGLLTRRGDPIRVEAESGDHELLGDVPVRKKPTTKGPPWTVQEQPDGKKLIKINAQTMERAAELAQHALRAHEVPGNRPAEISASQVRSFAPKIPIKIELGGPVELRAVAKSCVNALAVCLTPSDVLGSPFQQIRDYVLYGVDHCDDLLAGGADPHPAFACWDSRAELFPTLPDKCNLGPIDHRLLIRGCGGERTVYATFELFGHIPVSVLLTDAWGGKDFCWGLVTDPRPEGNGHWRGPLDLDLRPALNGAAVMAHVTDIGRLKPGLNQLTASLSKLLDQRAMDNLFTECVNEALGPQDGLSVTKEKMNELISIMAERIVEQAHQLESKTAIEVPPELRSPQ